MTTRAETAPSWTAGFYRCPHGYDLNLHICPLCARDRKPTHRTAGKSRRETLMTTLTAYCPSYLPWKALFQRVKQADIFVLTDTDRYTPKDFTNRNRIRTKNGDVWLTVPVLGGRDQKVMDVEIDNSKRWRQKHKATIQAAYSKTPYWDPGILEVYGFPWQRLASLNSELLDWTLHAYGIKTRVHRARDHWIRGTGSTFILNLCKHFLADKYICGPNGRNYLNLPEFEAAGVQVDIQDYDGPSLSAIHHLFTEGPVL